MSDADQALGSTLPGRVALRAQQTPAAIALRHKRRGIWREISWKAYAQQVAACARGLWGLGVRAGEQVAILSDNRPEWLYADLGAQSIGARTVGIYQTSPPEEIAYILNHSGARALVCEDQEQVDKFLQIAAHCPCLEHVLVIEPRGTRSYPGSYPGTRLTTFDEAISAGQAGYQDQSEWWAERLSLLDAKAPTMVVYTPGTTGEPKGVLLSSANIIPALPDFIEALHLDSKRPEVLLSYLPLCHVAEKLLTQFVPLETPAIVHFSESVDTVLNDLREVSPTIFLGVPRIWEKLHADIQMRMKDSSWLKRRLFDHFTGLAVRFADARRTGELGLGRKIHLWLGDLLVFHPLLERLGLRRCKRAISGAAPIGRELISLYEGIGLTIREGFGMTETAGISHLTRPGAERRGTVGQPVGCMEQRVTEDGEILLRGPTVFVGYLNDEAATPQTVDADGWLHTGDVGAISEDGHLAIAGRKTEIIITAGGESVSPDRVENTLRASPFIKEAIAIGDGRKFVAALVQIELETVSHWAQGQGLAYTAFKDLSGKPEVTMLIDAEIGRLNGLLVSIERVRRFELLRTELSQGEGELTATQKVRRAAVCVRYEDAIETMYLEDGA